MISIEVFGSSAAMRRLALGLLGANVGMMVIGASLTLAAQNRLRRRALDMAAERSSGSTG
jgi:hypothetical protein